MNKAAGENHGFQQPRFSPHELWVTTSRFVSVDIVDTSVLVGRIGCHPEHRLPPLVAHPASKLAIKISVAHFAKLAIQSLLVFECVEVFGDPLGFDVGLGGGIDTRPDDL
ncbi:hypothetical protein MNR02_14860 [Shinella sp. H4-D48]|uniref:hypothetical protein n=1 Tax=Shinella sp. H4-D48 TaxID=2925841 RepID=UPI001F53A3EB|nr:hypothetical protein [Shinella sp. H4-D48]UNK37729.1 hypothetical protein MNR02_14860 [Shinella sp. H4-D48]